MPSPDILGITEAERQALIELTRSNVARCAGAVTVRAEHDDSTGEFDDSPSKALPMPVSRKGRPEFVVDL